MKMLRYMTLVSVLFCSIGGAHPRSVLAQSFETLPAWTHTASSCTPDESSLRKFSFSDASFAFFGNEISGSGLFLLPIIVRCNVLNPLDEDNPIWNTFIIGYQDPDGTGTSSQVSAMLVRVARPTGILSTIAFFNSHAYASTAKREGSVQFNHYFDFLNNEYYVEIRLLRNTTNYKPQAFSARLTRTETIK
jgi:hypothetical protein